MVSKDQITVKVHKFAKKDVETLNKNLYKHYKFDNEAGLFDIAIYRLVLDAGVGKFGAGSDQNIRVLQK